MQTSLNEWFASNRIPRYTQGTLGSPGGKHIASCWKEMYGEKLFPRQKNGILEGDQHFFALFLSQMDSGNVEMRKM